MLVAGMSDTRAALARWNAAPWGTLRAWLSGALVVASARNSLVLALHAFACVAGFIAGSSLALSAARRLVAEPREAAPGPVS